MSRRTAPTGASGPATADPAAALLRGGVLPAALTAVVVVAGSALWGGRAAVGAAVGALVVLLAMSAGPLILRGSRDWSPPAVMAAAMIGYGTVVVLLGLVYKLVGRAGWLSATHLGVALVVVCAGWTAGELRAAWKLRVLAFGSPVPAPDGAPDGPGGEPDSPGQDG